jgi:hypothetical protein
MLATIKARLVSWAPDRVLEWRRRRALRREIMRLDGECEKEVQAAHVNEKMEIYSRWDFDTGWSRAELGELETERLRRRAERRGLEIPQDDVWWIKHLETNTKYLTPTARARVKRMIRQDRRESAKWWVDVLSPVLGALTGLIGALIGLLALLK